MKGLSARAISDRGGEKAEGGGAEVSGMGDEEGIEMWSEGVTGKEVRLILYRWLVIEDIRCVTREEEQ